tara:strand:+ start:187 stop:534 length:348 start_codon:yes stop_codon:yes gene_type:complete
MKALQELDPNKYYTINPRIWITDPSQVDKSTWIVPEAGSANRPNHGPRMKPGTKTGRMCVGMAMDARNNPGIARTGDGMLKFITEEAVKVGMTQPEATAKGYSKTWLNERLILRV